MVHKSQGEAYVKTCTVAHSFHSFYAVKKIIRYYLHMG